MTKEEVNYILYKLTYNDYVSQLKNKYGKVPKDYFYTNKNGELTKTSRITRGKDGLYIHHVYENEFLGLSDPIMYKLQLLTDSNKIKEAQKAENLVYCNLLEHLILHIKIAFEYNRGAEQVGIDFITGDLNRLYELGDKNLIEKTYTTPQHLWKRTVYNLIKDDYEIYVLLGKIIINELGISKYLVCNVTFYNTCYQKLYNDLSEVSFTETAKKSIIDKIKNTTSKSQVIAITRQYMSCRDTDIYFALLDKQFEFNISKIQGHWMTIVCNLLSIDNSINTIERLSKYSIDDINKMIELHKLYKEA